MSATSSGKPNNLWVAVQFYRKEIRFLILFIFILAFLNFLYFLCGGTRVEDFFLSELTAKPAYAVIKFLTPAEQAELNGTYLTSPHVNFQIVRGCEGMEGMLLMISAICAFSIPWKDKLKGILYGIAFIYVFNLFRLVGLYYLMRYHVSAFNFVHLFIGQSITIILVSIFFIIWISRSMKKNEDKASG